MKKWLIVCGATLIFLLGGVFADVRAADVPKIGMVDLFRALNESEAGKRAKGDLETVIKSKQVSIDEKGKGIEKAKADMEKQAAILSPDAKKAKEEEIERMIRDYQRVVADSQQEVKKKENELTGSILKELRELIARIGQEESYTLVLENAEGIMLYHDKSLEITDRLIKRYNESKTKESK
ncbi:MAG TPA: OmpH family outer membrane protein [Dissulfurispiraceae bacterium]|nr:OmpH family outer membrane protein [Dissulfurispiraceae bacterium]